MKVNPRAIRINLTDINGEIDAIARNESRIKISPEKHNDSFKPPGINPPLSNDSNIKKQNTLANLIGYESSEDSDKNEDRNETITIPAASYSFYGNPPGVLLRQNSPNFPDKNESPVYVSTPQNRSLQSADKIKREKQANKRKKRSMHFCRKFKRELLSLFQLFPAANNDREIAVIYSLFQSRKNDYKKKEISGRFFYRQVERLYSEFQSAKKRLKKGENGRANFEWKRIAEDEFSPLERSNLQVKWIDKRKIILRGGFENGFENDKIQKAENIGKIENGGFVYGFRNERDCQEFLKEMGVTCTLLKKPFYGMDWEVIPLKKSEFRFLNYKDVLIEGAN